MEKGGKEDLPSSSPLFSEDFLGEREFKGWDGDKGAIHSPHKWPISLLLPCSAVPLCHSEDMLSLVEPQRSTSLGLSYYRLRKARLR